MIGIEAVRQKMVDGQIRPGDVTDLRIIDAMTALPREPFVAPSQTAMAYLDIEADMGRDRRMPKAIVVAKLLQAADIGPADTVLVVGCGTGYTAALAGKLAKSVTGVESDPDLVRRAQSNFAALTTNCRVVQGPLTAGDPAGATYDVIVVDGAAETGLEALAQQLADGGRLVGVLKGRVSQAVAITRTSGEIGQRILFDASAPLLPGFAATPSFVF